jgi:hypothetical protein
LVEAVKMHGETLADWLEEQITVTVPEAGDVKTRESLCSRDPASLVNSEAAYRELAAQDWAFSEEDTRHLTHDLHPYPYGF